MLISAILTFRYVTCYVTRNAVTVDGSRDSRDFASVILTGMAFAIVLAGIIGWLP